MNLRSRLSTLIAARVVIGTLLLGSAILIQISRPGAFPVDPFFALIGLTYALSVLYLATLRFAERHPWLVDLQFGADAMLVSAFIHVTGGIASNFSSLYLLPIIAASMIRSRRVALQVAGLSADAVSGARAGAVRRRRAAAARAAVHADGGAADARRGPVYGGHQPERLLRRGPAGRVARGEPALGGRAPRVRLARDPRSPQVQRVRDQQPAERSRDDGRGRPDSDVQPGGVGDSRHLQRPRDQARRDRGAAAAAGRARADGEPQRDPHAQDRHPASNRRRPVDRPRSHGQYR